MKSSVAIFVVSVCLIMTSCTIEKRHYRNGFYWNNREHRQFVLVNSNEESYRDSNTTVLIADVAKNIVSQKNPETSEFDSISVRSGCKIIEDTLSNLDFSDSVKEEPEGGSAQNKIKVEENTENSRSWIVALLGLLILFGAVLIIYFGAGSKILIVLGLALLMLSLALAIMAIIKLRAKKQECKKSGYVSTLDDDLSGAFAIFLVVLTFCLFGLFTMLLLGELWTN